MCPPLLDSGQLHPTGELRLGVETVIVAGAVVPADDKGVPLALVLDDFMRHGVTSSLDDVKLVFLGLVPVAVVVLDDGGEIPVIRDHGKTPARGSPF